jgi:Mg2+ and Co2+ transporter CorA
MSADPKDLGEQLEAMAQIDGAEESRRIAELERQVVEMRSAVEEAAKAAIPSKSTQLRRLMEHAAAGLDGEVEKETKRAEYSRQLTPRVVAVMTEASAILRTVAVYVHDEP